ncbi:MAG: twitching motility protein PilT, partial [Phycisphaerae bacterium]|nr:twitching motility protein PilT [Phycisphaerae bacterium]NIX01432.1 twitching motility protein PilT [Phycisphaerae bacterium]
MAIVTESKPVQKNNSATFRYLGGLENLLVRRYRASAGEYRFKGTPGVKDAIETMGIPHTEVDVILVNNRSEDFSYKLQHKDQVAVYPVGAELQDRKLIHLSPQIVPPVKFILDVHLGSLARRLRLLGFDSLYRNDFADAEIIDISVTTERVILTRDLGILKQKQVRYGYLVRSDHLEKQVDEVMERFLIRDHAKPFSRCMACNGRLVAVDKQEV